MAPGLRPGWRANAVFAGEGPSDSAFAGEHGWLRQQISTAAVPPGSDPTAQPNGAADRRDPTVDYTGDHALPADTAWRWRSTFTAPSSGSWQLNVLVKNQSAAQLFVDGLATAQRRVNLGAYGLTGGFGGSTVPVWEGLDQTQKSHDPALAELQQGTYTVTFNEGETQTLDLRAYANSTDTLSVRFHWVRPNWPQEKIAEAVEARSAKTAVVFAYPGHEHGIAGVQHDDRVGVGVGDGRISSSW